MKLSERFLDEAEGYGPGPVTLHDVDIKHLQWLLREAAALARRVEEAPVVLMAFGEYTGKHVRIVEE